MFVFSCIASQALPLVFDQVICLGLLGYIQRPISVDNSRFDLGENAPVIRRRAPSRDVGAASEPSVEPEGLLEVPDIEERRDVRRRAAVAKAVPSPSAERDPIFPQLALYFKNPTFQVFLGSQGSKPFPVVSSRNRNVATNRFVLNTRDQVASRQAHQHAVLCCCALLTLTKKSLLSR